MSGEAAVATIIEEAPDEPDGPIELKEAGLSQRDALLAVADVARIWRSLDGETFATVPVGGHVEHHGVSSRGFRDWMIAELARRYLNKGRPASASESAVRDARMGLEARAHVEGIRNEGSLRVARHQGRVYLDLGTPEWNAIEVAPAGWQVVAQAPVPILRSRRTGAFAHPDPDADFGPLADLLGQMPDDDIIMFVAWCLGALLPEGPYPILILGGEQGSGKSTLARLAQRLVDPVAGDLLQPPGDDRDLIAAARNNRVLAFDNFSGIRADLADSLCRLATGSEIGGRALYSNHDTASFSACRPLILNGIPDLAARGDLADRAVVLRLDAPAQRMTERDWSKAVDSILPSTFGALLNAVSTGLARLEATPTPDVRMADFAGFVAAAEPALPWAEGQFLSVYRRNRSEAVAVLAEGDPVANAVRTFINTHSGGWSGLVSDLYKILSAAMSPDERRSGDWPGNPRWFSDRLRRASPALRALGIDVAERRGGQGIIVSIRKIASLATPATFAEVAGCPASVANVASVANSPLLKERTSAPVCHPTAASARREPISAHALESPAASNVAIRKQEPANSANPGELAGQPELRTAVGTTASNGPGVAARVPEVDDGAAERGDRTAWSEEDWQALFDERAGIMEFDGGQSREEAEAAEEEVARLRSTMERGNG